MPDRNGAGGVIAIAGFIVAVIAIALLALGGEIFARQPLLMLVQALAVVLMVWARLTFGLRSFNPGAAPTEGELVTTGPYRCSHSSSLAACTCACAARSGCLRRATRIIQTTPRGPLASSLVCSEFESAGFRG
jgi:hypothetical protein